MIAYRATLDVPAETVWKLSGWLAAHRKTLGTRKGRRAASCYRQAVMVLRWFRDDTRMRMLARDAGLGISTAYRYLHEGIAVLAAAAPDLHEVLDPAMLNSTRPGVDPPQPGRNPDRDRPRRRENRTRQRPLVLRQAQEARRERPGPV